MNLEKLAGLSIGLGAAIGVLWIFLLMIREWKKKGNGNGHLTEDKLRLILAEELKATRHDLRNAMQAVVAAVRDEIRNFR